MKRTLLALALTAALPFAAQASELSYNYIEGGYSRVSGSPKVDGWGLKGSVALGSNFHAFGGYTQYDVSRSTIDIDYWNLGVGYNHSLGQNADLVARAAYQRAKVSGFSSLDGWFTEVGVRGMLAPSFEGYVFAGYENGDDIDSEFYGRVGAQYKFTQNFGLVADVKFVDGDQEYFIGPRISF